MREEAVYTTLDQTYTYLWQIRKTTYAIKRKKAEYEELFHCHQPAAVRYDIDRVQKSITHDQFADADLIAASEDLAKLRRKKKRLIIEISDAIERLPNDIEKTVLALHYIKNMRMEKIAEEIHYSKRQAYEFRKKGVLHLSEML